MKDRPIWRWFYPRVLIFGTFGMDSCPLNKLLGWLPFQRIQKHICEFLPLLLLSSLITNRTINALSGVQSICNYFGFYSFVILIDSGFFPFEGGKSCKSGMQFVSLNQKNSTNRALSFLVVLSPACLTLFLS